MQVDSATDPNLGVDVTKGNFEAVFPKVVDALQVNTSGASWLSNGLQECQVTGRKGSTHKPNENEGFVEHGAMCTCAHPHHPCTWRHCGYARYWHTAKHTLPIRLHMHPSDRRIDIEPTGIAHRALLCALMAVYNGFTLCAFGCLLHILTCMTVGAGTCT